MPVIGPDVLFSPAFSPAVVAQVRGLVSPASFAVAQAEVDPPAQSAEPTAVPVTDEPAVEGEGGSPGTLAPGTTTTSAPPAPRPSGIFGILSSPIFPLALIMVFFYVFMISGNKKKEKARKEMINTLARGDKVTTIGGIIGSVVDAAGDEVTLKVDENNNTKLRITRSAVATVARPGTDAK